MSHSDMDTLKMEAGLQTVGCLLFLCITLTWNCTCSSLITQRTSNRTVKLHDAWWGMWLQDGLWWLMHWWQQSLGSRLCHQRPKPLDSSKCQLSTMANKKHFQRDLWLTHGSMLSNLQRSLSVKFCMRYFMQAQLSTTNPSILCSITTQHN